MSDNKAVIYARYSSDAQRETSIDQQVRVCRAYAQQHGIEIVGVYDDRAMTGTNDKRPQFRQMIRDASKRDWQHVIVYALDRFARDRYDSARYKHELKIYGVKVLSATEPISDDPSGIILESVLEGMAEYYSAELSRKTTRGMDDNAARCRVNGVLPYGYKRSDDYKYAVDEPAAAVVREIFDRIVDGEHQSSICADLNRRGVRTSTGKAWNRSSLHRILANERYTGIYIYKDTRIPGGVPEIVRREVWERAQVALCTKPNPQRDTTGKIPQRRRREGGTYLLTGKIYCGTCGNAMTGISGTGKNGSPHYYYACIGRRADHGSCTQKNLRREMIELTVAQLLRDTMLTDDAIIMLADAAVAAQNQDSILADLDGFRQQLASVNAGINNIMRAIEAGIFTATTKDRLMELEDQRRELGYKIADAEQITKTMLTREEIIAVLEMYKDGDITDKGYQETLVDAFLIACYVYSDHIKIVFDTGTGAREHALPLHFDIDGIDADGAECLYNEHSGSPKCLIQTLGINLWLVGSVFMARKSLP